MSDRSRRSPATVAPLERGDGGRPGTAVSMLEPDADLGPTRVRRKPAVMSDVAKLAGVSTQTVSRVLNDGVVSAVTRERVLEAIELLGYRPNSAARALVTGRSRTIGIVSPDETLHGPATTMLGIEHAAQGSDYFTSVAFQRDYDRAAVIATIRRLQHEGVEGILVLASRSSTVSALESIAEDVPLVAVLAGPDEGMGVATVDQDLGARLATQHLLDLGHRTIAHVAGPEHSTEAMQRRHSWQATLAAAGARPTPPLVGDWSPASGYALGRSLLEQPEVTAAFVANDQMALGVIAALHEAGRSVPDDLSVVGYDDIPEAQYLTPALTTIAQPFEEMGRVGFELLLAQLDSGRRTTAIRTLRPQLVVRRSAMAPPAGGSLREP